MAITTATLFGIALAPLYAAIAQVESDNGKTSANVYQIDDGLTEATGVYVKDVNLIVRMRRLRGLESDTETVYCHADVYDRRKPEEMMRIYWAYYGRLYEVRTGKKVTEEVLARIHNGGPSGWSRTATEAYWNKVKARLESARRGGNARK